MALRCGGWTDKIRAAKAHSIPLLQIELPKLFPSGMNVAEVVRRESSCREVLNLVTANLAVLRLSEAVQTVGSVRQVLREHSGEIVDRLTSLPQRGWNSKQISTTGQSRMEVTAGRAAAPAHKGAIRFRSYVRSPSLCASLERLCGQRSSVQNRRKKVAMYGHPLIGRRAGDGGKPSHTFAQSISTPS